MQACSLRLSVRRPQLLVAGGCSSTQQRRPVFQRRAKLHSTRCSSGEPTHGPELTVKKVWERLDPALLARGYDTGERLVLMKATQAAFLALNEESEPSTDGEPGDALVLTSVRNTKSKVLSLQDGRVPVEQLVELLLNEAVHVGCLSLEGFKSLGFPVSTCEAVETALFAKPRQ